MRILHVVPSLALRHGGVSGFVRELSRGLAHLGESVEVWTTPRGYDPKIDAPYDERLKADGVHLRYFPAHPFPLLGERYAYSPSLKVALGSDLHPFDLVHLHALWQYPTAAAAGTCQRLQIPYLVSPHGALDPYSLRRRRTLKKLYGLWIEQRTLKKAAALHFTSCWEQARSHTFGAQSPQVVVPCPISTEEIPSTPMGTFRRRYPEVQDRRILLFLGRLHPKKRLDIVAEAFVQVAQRFNDLHLVLAGPDDGASSKTLEKVRRAGLTDRVTFTGLLTGQNKWAAFRDTTLFLLPSEDENFGMAALEAMAVGVPILVSDHVGIAETATRYGAGLAIKLHLASWTRAVEELLEKPQKAQAMGEAGKHLVKNEFGMERVAAAMREVYLQILKGSDPKGSDPFKK